MTKAWPEPVERVADFLKQAGAEARIEEFDEDAATAADAARAAGCAPEQIVKSVLLVADGTPMLVLAPGDRRLDVKKIARAVEAKKARFATHEEVEAARAAVDGVPLEFTFVGRRQHDISLRWVYAHMIEEYARHNGHADLIRERIDGTTGD